MKNKKEGTVTKEDIQYWMQQLNELPKTKYPPFEKLGLQENGLYYMGSGCYGNKASWESFNKELKRRINNWNIEY